MSVRTTATAVVLALVMASCAAGQSMPPAAVETTEAPITTTTAPTTTTTTMPPTTTEAADAAADHDDGDAGHDASDADHDDPAAAGDEADRVVEVVMTEFAFEPETVEVSAGETVRFDIRNDGAVLHEFRLSNTHRIEEHLESGHDGHGDDGHHGADADVYLELGPGEAGSLVVAFPEDTTFFTEAACLIPGHYEAGMTVPVAYR
ncbi:MAG: cupredoxin domain-containing protein [Acidimicrobiia bacterium]